MITKIFKINMFLLICCFHGYVGSGIKFSIPNESLEATNAYWYSTGKADIQEALKKPIRNGIAKNVIIFVGDGMGMTITTAGRIYKGQKRNNSGEEESLVWEKFPNMALAKTYNLDKQVPDSAATATAFFGGVKGIFGTVGVNGGVKRGDCKSSLDASAHVTSILQWCQEAGKDTGIVTSTRVTHATPAALYAHSANRDWECDSKMKEEELGNCKDIARQLVEDLPGKNINVIFAGGRRQMGDPHKQDDDHSCRRNDSRNLVTEWKENKRRRGSSASYVTNTKELRDLDVENTDFVMGLFEDNHLPYEFERNKGSDGSPSLKELTVTAIKRLNKSNNGYFLMVEGGRIDHALHDTKPYIALEELLAFEEAVAATLQLINEEETLVIVTADHSHVMTINGYPERGNDILGTTGNEPTADILLPYTTLMFTNGYGANYTWDGEKVVRANLTGVDTRDPHFISQSAVHTPPGSETHSGEDVAVFATGPAAHLFQRVHEQSYVAHVMGFASRVGPYKQDFFKPEEFQNIRSHASPELCSVSASLSTWLILFFCNLIIIL